MKVSNKVYMLYIYFEYLLNENFYSYGFTNIYIFIIKFLNPWLQFFNVGPLIVLVIYSHLKNQIMTYKNINFYYMVDMIVYFILII